MLVCISPKMSVSKFMGILKGKSSLMIFDRFAQLKYKYQMRLKEYIDPFTRVSRRKKANKITATR